MEIRDPRYKPDDYVVNGLGVKGFVVRVEGYSFDDDEYTYIVKKDESFIDEEVFINEFEYNLYPCKKPPKTVWDLQRGDKYYVIDDSGLYGNVTFDDDTDDSNYRKIGNCFLTKEDAEYEIERRKIETEMLRLGGRRNFKFNGKNYSIYYSDGINVNGINVEFYHSTMHQGSIYFDSKEQLNEVVKTIGLERIKKYIFGVEE